jgi:hypothetical protein
VEQALIDVLHGMPAAMLVGPRASGKTTTAKRLVKTIVRLDRAVEAEAVKADPDAVLGPNTQRCCAPRLAEGEVGSPGRRFGALSHRTRVFRLSEHVVALPIACLWGR